MKLKTLLLIAAVITATLVGLATPAGATVNVVSDTLADNGPNHRAEGDINAHGASYTDDLILVSVQSRVPTNPATDPNWVDGTSAVIWDLDTNGDGVSDYWVIVSNFLGVKANVYDEDDWSTPLCAGTPSYDAGSTGVIVVGFPASCIGTPAGFGLQTYFHYSSGSGVDSFDFAPNSGFGAAVTRTVTATPPDPTTTTTSPTAAPADPPLTTAGNHDGYWMLSTGGTVWGFGTAGDLGAGTSVPNVHIEPTPTGDGYWVLDALGTVVPHGDARNLGSANVPYGEKAVSMSSTPTGSGYWVFTDKGRVLTYGDARHFGDMSGVTLNGPVLGSVATPTGKGYWLVGSDGGIFSFGDAAFHGSTGAMKLNKPVMAMAPSPDGAGYWLVASDGGIFAFDVPFYGSAGNLTLNKPISGMVPGRGGYMMVAQDGGIFSFGDVPFHGSLGATPPASPIVSVALQP